MRRAIARIVPEAFAAGVAGLIASFAVAGLTPAFVGAPIDSFLARAMPGAVVTFAIETFGSLGQRLNFLTALFIAAALLGVVATIGVLAGRAIERPVIGVGLSALLAGLVANGLTGAPGAATATGIAVATVVAAGEIRLPQGEAEFSTARRRTLVALASVAGVSTLSIAVADRGFDQTTGTEPSSDMQGNDASFDGDDIPTLLDEANEKSLDVAGIEPLVSEKFYTVDINSVDPTLDTEDWSLTITGAVESETTITYDDLTGMGPENRFVTLRCVGEDLNGKKMDNALWTGVPITDMLAAANPQGNYVMLRAADDYFEEFPIAALERAFLAYGMNGDVLPRGHGYPVRALVPGHWGEINVKWLTEIEVLEQEMDGYWEKRGWHGTGPVNTVAKIHAVNHLEDGRIQVGGHAYAGTRGISRVEVSTDGGKYWQEATLSDPLPGEDVWRQWMIEYDPPSGKHEVVARATDANGTLQEQEPSKSFPSGPTGWVRETVTPQ